MADAAMMKVRLRRRRRARIFQRRKSPLKEYSDADLYKRYLFTSATNGVICWRLRPILQRRTARSKSLSVEMQVLITLRCLACGSFQEVVGVTLGVQKSTVSRVIQRVTAALCGLLAEYARLPTAVERREAMTELQRIANFPAAFGCIDGTHVRIQAPSANEVVFVNRKGVHSINVQAVCDHQGKFTNLVAKWPGSSHDSHVFNTSELKRSLDGGPHRMFLLGDSGYACKPYLLKPYMRPRDHQQEAFNVAHKKTRATIDVLLDGGSGGSTYFTARLECDQIVSVASLNWWNSDTVSHRNGLQIPIQLHAGDTT